MTPELLRGRLIESDLPILPPVSACLPNPLPSTAGLGLLKAGDSVLFIGDSITDAFSRPDEINIAHQLGSGYALMIGARLMREHPAARLHFINRGLAGNRVTDLAARWHKDCIGLAPGVVSILAGVNSTLAKFKPGMAPVPDADYEYFYDTYDALLRDLVSGLPEVRLVIGEPFLMPCGLGNEEMLADLRARTRYLRILAGKYRAIFVPFQSAFDDACSYAPPEYWVYDGIHPTAAGFWLMAETWIKCVVENNATERGFES